MAQQLPMDFMLPEVNWETPTELPDLRGRGVIALDTETKDDGLSAKRGPGWVYGAGYVCGVSAAAPGAPAVYIPLRHPDSVNFDKEAVGRWLEDHMTSGDLMVFQNAHYDLGWIWKEFGIRVDGGVADTIAAASLLEEERRSYSLDNLCKDAGIVGKDENALRQAANAYGVDPKSGMWKLPAKFVGEYAVQDAVATLELWQWQQARIRAQNMEYALSVECDLIPMVVEMRRRGIRIDIDRAEQVAEQLDEKCNEVLAELSRRTAYGKLLTIENLNSPVFLEDLHKREGVRYPNTAKTGKGSFSKDWMENHEHWLPSMIIQARNFHSMSHKFLHTYILDYVHKGRIHAEIHQYRNDDGGARTSRFAYANPPLQQIPSRDPIAAPLVRSAFIPEEGEIWSRSDVSQQEYRLIVHFAELCGLDGAEEAGNRYRQDPTTDFHTLVSELTGLDRKKSKDTNFAKSFGAGIPKFALMTNKTEAEAEAIMQQYDEKMPFNSQLNKKCKTAANQRGYVILIDGTRAHFDKWEPSSWDARKGYPSVDRETANKWIADEGHHWYRQRLVRADTRKAMNKLIQGSAARQTKKAMLDCWKDGLCPMLQVHDELNFSLSDEATGKRINSIMANAVELTVPVLIDTTYGPNWGAAKKEWHEL